VTVACCELVRVLKRQLYSVNGARLRFKCDGTHAETRFRFSTKRTSLFKIGGGVSSADYWEAGCAHQPAMQGLYCSCKPVFCSHVTLTGFPLHSLVSLPLPCVTVCHHISTGIYYLQVTVDRQGRVLQDTAERYRYFSAVTTTDIFRKSVSLVVVIDKYSTPPLTRIKWDGEPFGYAEYPDNWIFV
jgi:hypothetical protein